MSRKKAPPWQKEHDEIAAILKPFGGELSRSQHQYEAFIYKGEGVHLIFYPHRSSAFHYSIRVRDSNSKNPQRADDVMRALWERGHFKCKLRWAEHFRQSARAAQ